MDRGSALGLGFTLLPSSISISGLGASAEKAQPKHGFTHAVFYTARLDLVTGTA